MCWAMCTFVDLGIVDAMHDFFFFQAEDGIRDYKVTGVQTCALPISKAFNGIGDIKKWLN